MADDVILINPPYHNWGSTDLVAGNGVVLLQKFKFSQDVEVHLECVKKGAGTLKLLHYYHPKAVNPKALVTVTGTDAEGYNTLPFVIQGGEIVAISSDGAHDLAEATLRFRATPVRR